jgi:hypothetical protein
MELSNNEQRFLNSLENFKENFHNFHVPQQWSNQNTFNVFHKTKTFGTKEITYFLNESYDDYKVFTSLQTDIKYVFNRFGFRSNNFKQLDNDSINIITSGCSNTFGQEMPNEGIWPTLLANQISKNNNVNLNNLGVSGLETFRIIRNCYSFVENYGKPDYIFLLLPPIQRFLFLDKEYNTFNTKQDPVFTRNIDDLFKTFFKKKSNLPSNLINNIITLKNFESFCNINNIKLFWFSWDRNSQKIYETLNFKNLVNQEKIESNMQNIINNYKNQDDRYWHFAADNDHQGLKFHLCWAASFYDCLSNK